MEAAYKNGYDPGKEVESKLLVMQQGIRCQDAGDGLQANSHGQSDELEHVPF